MKSHKFSKTERLRSNEVIGELFHGGVSVFTYPIKLLFQKAPYPEVMEHQIAISVTKKRFKNAVDRNVLKRRLKESYRLNKQLIGACPPLQILIVYIGKEIEPYDKCNQSLIKILSKVKESAGHTATE